MITITHSFAEGTLVQGTTRGDGSYGILTGSGWRWFRSLSMCGIRQSRDRLAKNWMINAAVAALRAAGLDVAEPEIDNDPRPMEEREADRAARMDGPTGWSTARRPDSAPRTRPARSAARIWSDACFWLNRDESTED